MLKIHIAYLFLLCFSIELHSQHFVPDVTNYGVDQYALDSQNWGVDVNDEGTVFVANNAGLLVYKGQKWEKYYLPNKTIIRSVLCVGDRIYTGSYEEFGYWTKDDYGSYNYISLVPLFEKSRSFADEQFWQIIHYRNDIFFKSFSGGVYVYSDNKISYIKDSFGTYDMCVFDDSVVFASRTKGLTEFKNDKAIPFVLPFNTADYKSLNNVASNNGSQLFFFDLLKGAFVYDKKLKRVKPLPQNLNDFLHDNILNKAIFLSDTRLVLGTIKKGIIIYDLTKRTTQFIHGALGLQNNTVLGLASYEHNLWVSLDNGISKVNTVSPINFYTDISGSLGTVYDIAFFEKNYYLGSNTGVYTFSENKQLHLIDGLEDHVWDIYATGQELIIGHNNGCFVIEKDQLLKKVSLNGVFSTVEIPNQKASYLQGTYYGINILKKENDEWKSKVVEGVPFMVDKIVFESQNVIWASHPYKGIYRIGLNADHTKAVHVTNYGNQKNFSQNKINVYEINGAILFYNANTWFTYFQEQDSIGKSAKFQKFNNNDFVGKENNGRWFVNRTDNSILTFFDKENEEKLKIDAAEIKSRVVSKYEKISVKNDSIRLLNLNDGFALFNINELKKQNPNFEIPPSIDKIYSNNNRFVASHLSELEIPYLDAQYLTFEIHSPGQYGNNHIYSLSGEIEQSELVKDGVFTLQNLNHGDYTLSLSNAGLGKDLFRKVEFKVLPPWYLSLFFKVLYGFLFVGIVFGVYAIHRRNLRKHKRKTYKKFMRKMQDKIDELKKQSLEQELKNKTIELVGFAEANVEKNEIIMVLSNELQRTQKGDVNKSRILKVLATSKVHLKKNREWNVFKKNFDELNTDFLNKLIQEFPKMTTKDLRLCAYIKTGLSSKEIAPLLGISVRGVEHHRNRLRKKMNISPKEKLSFFLEHYNEKAL